ncbi:MAG TPA: hypothetical protein VLK65_30995 [Vicinamibacteria bacterium]|nr:hypothetical protein [Vicinamibacteria bacterium]
MDAESYYASVESHFVARRGSPLFITPSEWDLVWRWEQSGIPLEIVKEAIDRVFERPQALQKRRKLGYCRQAVDAAFRRFREARVGEGTTSAEEAQVDYVSRLSGLADRLMKAAETAGSRDRPLADTVRTLACEVAATDAATSAVKLESKLAAIDARLLAALEITFEEALRSSLRTEAERSLESYRDRMPEKVYRRALESAYHRRLRSQLGLGPLSIF